MNKLLTYLSVPVVLLTTYLLLFMVSPASASTAEGDPAIAELMKPVWEAITQGNWWLAAALGLVFLVAVFKRYGGYISPKAAEFANSDPGGALLVLLGSFGGALATGLAAEGVASISGTMAWTALSIAITAAGGYALVRKLVMPIVKPFIPMLPGWLQSVVNMALWMFEKTPTVEAVKAGDAAVAANPSEGVSEVIGEPKDVP